MKNLSECERFIIDLRVDQHTKERLWTHALTDMFDAEVEVAMKERRMSETQAIQFCLTSTAAELV